MKKSLALFLSLFIFSLSYAETVKPKDGTFLSGSIVSQTEYTLNLNTSYGPVVLNQREVEAILPDKHRVFLKGGSQLVGVIIDLDEFNMKLQTNEGTVNIDMPQIVSVEVYDYEQGESAKQTITQKQIQQQEALAKEAARQAALSASSTTSAATSGTVQAAGGLTFDSDIEKVFDVKKAEVVNGQVQTVQEISAADIRAQRAAQMSEEEAFLKGISPVKSEEKIQKTAEAARSGKLEKIKKAEAKKAKRPKDANSNKYFAITIGNQTGDLKLDNSKRPGFSGTEPYNVGGNGVRAEAAFLWRLKSSNLWLGPALAITNIPNASFEDLDPAVTSGNEQSMIDNGYLIYDPEVSTSGQMIDIMAKANYYFNPDHLFSVYLTGNIGYRMLSLNYRGGIESTSIDANTFIASAGLGVETHVDDMMLGIEVQEFFSPYSGQLKDSDSANTVISAKISWKF